MKIEIIEHELLTQEDRDQLARAVGAGNAWLTAHTSRMAGIGPGLMIFAPYRVPHGLVSNDPKGSGLHAPLWGNSMERHGLAGMDKTP